MNKIYGILIAVLRSEILAEPLSEDIKKSITPEIIENMYMLSGEHDLAHIVSDAVLKNGLLLPGDEKWNKLRDCQLMAVYRSEQMAYELARICECFNETEVPFIQLKGSVLRSYYPESWMRTSCDIDILVQREDCDRACRKLNKMFGYVKTGHTSHDVSLRSRGGVHLELHFTMLAEGTSSKAESVLSDVWKHAHRVSQDSCEFVLDDEFFYLYHIAHMAKHFKTGGCGIRPFIDLWFLNHKKDYVPEERNKVLSCAGLLKFAQAAEHLSDVWFADAPPDRMSELIQNYIFKGGVYGSVRNRVAMGHNINGGNRGYVLSRLFLPYNQIKGYYPRIGKYKIFLPVMEMHRIFKVIASGRTKQYIREMRAGNKIPENEKESAGEILRMLDMI